MVQNFEGEHEGEGEFIDQLEEAIERMKEELIEE